MNVKCRAGSDHLRIEIRLWFEHALVSLEYATLAGHAQKTLTTRKV